MQFPLLEHATDADKAALGSVAKAIRKERALARAYKYRLDNVSLAYQTQITALRKQLQKLHSEQDAQDQSTALESKLEEIRRDIQQKSDVQIAALENKLSTQRAAAQKTQAEKVAREQELSLARQSAATDANIISQLREEINQLLESKNRVATDSVEKHARNMQLLRQSRESESKVVKYEENNAFMKSEVLRLSQELEQTRTRMDSSTAVHDAAISTAHKTNKELANDLAKSNARAQKLANEVANAERNVIDLQADFDREKSDLRAEVENLGKLVEMHREATKDAEIRLAGYTEVLGTLAKEKKEAESRAPNATTNSDRHAEVLFKNLNKALDAKLQVLEKERHELSRARAGEARMASKQQGLLREVEAARRELNEARQQIVILEAELATDKDKIGELERRLLYASSAEAFQTASPYGPGDNSHSARILGARSATLGSGEGLPVQTPSPFRHSRLNDAEQALAGMVEIRRRHEALLQGLKERRDEYAELMRD